MGPRWEILAFLLLCLSSPAVAGDARGQSRQLPYVPNELLVKFSTEADPAKPSPAFEALATQYQVTQRTPLFRKTRDPRAVLAAFPKRSRRAPKNPVFPKLSSWIRLTYQAKIDPPQLAELFKALDEVEWAEPSSLMVAYRTPNDAYVDLDGDGVWNSGAWGQSFKDLWGLLAMKADAAWDLSTGSSAVVVAVVDTGLDQAHEDIAGNVWLNAGEDLNGNGVVDSSDVNGIDNDGNGYIDDLWGWDFRNNDRLPTDDNGHGTHVAGTIGAVGDNGKGIAGVVWRTRIMPLKFLNSSGNGATQDAAEAIQYAVDNGADILNNSWGTVSPGTPDQVVKDAVNYAHSLGAVILAAAGNNNADVGNETYGYSPACLNKVITVASSDRFDAKSSFSNWGQKIDVAAPGGDPSDAGTIYESKRNILSLLSSNASNCFGCVGDSGLRVGGSYLRQAGTSMAAPNAAGVCALILSENPDLSNEEVRTLLRSSADDVQAAGFDIYSGWGRVNAFKAITFSGVLETQPELLIGDLALVLTGGLWPQIDGDGSFFTDGKKLSVKIKNVGKIGASQVTVAISATDPAQGGIPLYAHEEILPFVPAEGTISLPTLDIPYLPGQTTLHVKVDSEDIISEPWETNNEETLVLHAASYSLLQERLSPNDQDSHTSPNVSGTKIVWHSDHPSLVNAYDIHFYDLGPDGLLGTSDDAGPFQISANDQKRSMWPRISGNKIVWQDDRVNGGEDIYFDDVYFYDLGADGKFGTSDDSGEKRLTPDDHTQWSPAISGNKIVWSDQRTGRFEIFLYNLGADGKFGTSDDIGPTQVSNLYAGNSTPDISGNKIVWTHSYGTSNSIFLYDLGADGKFGTSDDLGPYEVSPLLKESSPSISGNKIVWQSQRNGSGYIYFYDLGADGKFGTSDDSGEMQLTYFQGNQGNPRISGNRILWEHSYLADKDIFLYDLGPDGKLRTADDSGTIALPVNPDWPGTGGLGYWQLHPALSGDVMVWSDTRDYETRSCGANCSQVLFRIHAGVFVNAGDTQADRDVDVSDPEALEGYLIGTGTLSGLGLRLSNVGVNPGNPTVLNCDDAETIRAFVSGRDDPSYPDPYPATLPVLTGDLDKNGLLNANDQILLQQVAQDPSSFSRDENYRGDLNRDQQVDTQDVSLMADFLAGLIPEIPWSFPTLAHPTDRQVPEGKPVSFLIAGEDPDGDSLSISANLPSGANLTPAGYSGRTHFWNFVWTTPTEGSYTITYTVLDDNGNSGSTEHTIVVFPPSGGGNPGGGNRLCGDPADLLCEHVNYKVE